MESSASKTRNQTIRKRVPHALLTQTRISKRASNARFVLIGEAPGPSTRPDYPLFPAPCRSAGYKLFQLTGIETRGEYLNVFHRANLLRDHPGTWTANRGKDKWSVTNARFAAQGMLHFLSGREVIFVGRRVAEAFGHSNKKLPFLELSLIHI